MNNAMICDSINYSDKESIEEANALELNLAALGSEALKRIIGEVADETRREGVFANYDRVHNRHNR